MGFNSVFLMPSEVSLRGTFENEPSEILDDSNRVGRKFILCCAPQGYGGLPESRFFDVFGTLAFAGVTGLRDLFDALQGVAQKQVSLFSVYLSHLERGTKKRLRVLGGEKKSALFVDTPKCNNSYRCSPGYQTEWPVRRATAPYPGQR